MIQYLNQKRGQSTLEYAVLIIIVIAALLSIQVYIKRGLQGKMKQTTDDIGDQYSVGNTNVVERTITVSNTTERFGIDAAGAPAQGESVSLLRRPEQTNTEKRSVIINEVQEFWGN